MAGAGADYAESCLREQAKMQGPASLLGIVRNSAFSPRAGWEGVVDSLLFAQHAIEMFRRSLADGPPNIVSIGSPIG